MAEEMTKGKLADLLVGRKFSESTRKALFLVLVEGKGNAEVARLLGLHRNQIHRAIKMLRGE